MEKFTNLPVIRQVFQFSLEAFDFCEDLKSNRKKIFADKIINSVLVTALQIQVAFETDKKSVHSAALKKAEREVKNAIYWVKLYEKASTYYAKEELIALGEEIHEFCLAEIKKLQY